MAKLTVLEMTQNILSSMDSDNVNSISDTVESQQVVDILKETYFELIARRDWKFMRDIDQLESVSDVTKPTKIKIPEDVNKIECVRYRVDLVDDTREKWRTLSWEDPCDFVHRLQRRDSSASNVESITTDEGTTLYILNDKPPTYWTSFDDEFIYFDAYDSDVESTVEQSRSSVISIKEPAWTSADTFIPDLPSNMFTLLLNEAKSTSHLMLKQQANPKAEQIARRQYIKLRELENRAMGERVHVNYGR